MPLFTNPLTFPAVVSTTAPAEAFWAKDYILKWEYAAQAVRPASARSAFIYADSSHLGLLSPSARHCENKHAVAAIKPVLNCKRIFGASLK